MVGCKATGDIVIPTIHNGQVVIGIGSNIFDTTEDWDNRNLITSVLIPSTVKTISESAFEGCTALTEISIPSSVESIGNNAFKGCTGLEYVSMNEGLESIGQSAFENCSSLKSIVIPDSVNTIGQSAFKGCALEAMFVPFIGDSRTGTNQYFSYLFGDNAGEATNVPNTLSYVVVTGGNGLNRDQLPANAFENCNNIQNIVLQGSLSSGNSGFRRLANNTTGIKTIGNSAFKGCSSLVNVSMPNTVTSIGEEVFANCSSIETLIIPNSVTSLVLGCLQGLTNLKNLTIPFVGDSASGSKLYLGHLFGATTYSSNATYVPASLKKVEVTGDGEVGANAFRYCANIETIIISGTPSNLRSNCLSGCSSLVTLVIPFLTQTSTSTSSRSLYELFSSTSATYMPASLKTVQVLHGNGSDRDTISSNAFKDCANIETVILPDDLKTIGSNAFKNSGVVYITIPDSVTTLNSNLFDGATRLTYIKLGKNVTAIPMQAFNSCSALKTVEVSGNIPSIGGLAFQNCASLLSFEFSTGLSTLGNGCFKNCTSLTFIDLSNCTSLTELPVNTFEGCQALTTAFLKTKLTIGSSAFKDCISLSYVSNLKTFALIDEKAFQNCCSLTSIELGDTSSSSGTTIGKEAFSGCRGLVYIKFNTTSSKPLSIGANAFENCTSLKSINIPDYDPGSSLDCMGSMGLNAFKGCSSLQSLTLPFLGTTRNDPIRLSELCSGASNLKIVKLYDTRVIADYAFSGWSSITSITFSRTYNGKTTSIGKEAFKDCTGLIKINIPSGISFFGTGLFSGCTNLTRVDFETISDNNQNVQYLPDECFKNCISLVTVSNLTYVKTVGKYAFQNCHSLTELIGTNYSDKFSYLTAIDDYAFLDCWSLRNITLPNTIQRVGKNAFQRCYSLLSINLPGNSGLVVDDYAFEYCESLEYAVINDGVTKIGYMCFVCCYSLKELIIPDSVTSIGAGCVQGCTKLEKVVIPFIGFKYQTSGNISNKFADFAPTARTSDTLKVVVITGDQPIEQMAFERCYYIETIRFEGKPSSISAQAFNDCHSLKTLVVPYIGSGGANPGALLVGEGNPNTPIVEWVDTPINLPTNQSVIDQYHVHVTHNYWDYAEEYFESNNIDSSTWQEGDLLVMYSGYLYGTDSYGYYLYRYQINPDYPEYGLEWCYIDEEDYDLYDTGYTFPSVQNGHIYVGSIDTGVVFENWYNVSADNQPLTDYYDYDYPDQRYGYLDLDTMNFYYTSVSYIVGNENDVFISTSIGQLFRLVGDEWVFELVLGAPNSVLAGNSDPTSDLGNDGFTYFNTTSRDYFKKSNGAWVLLGNLNTLYTGIGFWFTGYSNEYGLPESLKTVEVNDSTAIIKEKAFANCKFIENIILCDGITEISNNAFSNCSSLLNVSIPNSVTTIGTSIFKDCVALETLSIPTSFASISEGMFEGCTNLKYVVIPSSIATISTSAFKNCTSLSDFVIPNTVTSIGLGAFEGCNNLKSLSIPFVGASATDHQFLRWLFGDQYNDNSIYAGFPESLKTITITGDIDTIPEQSFRNLKNIEYVNLPSSVKTIGNQAFMYDSKLICVNVENVETFGEHAFKECSSLKNVTFGNNLKTFYMGAFAGCDSFTMVKLSGTNVNFAGSVFGGCDSLMYVDLQFLEITALPQTIFNGCSSLTSVIFPEVNGTYTGLRTIGQGAFNSCSSLTSVKLPSTLVMIDDNAFEECISLTSVYIPSGVQFIGESAFEGCISITTVNFDISSTSLGHNVGSATIKDNAFLGCDNIDTIIVRGASGSNLTEKVTAYGTWLANFVSSTGNSSLAYNNAISGNTTSCAHFIFRS